MGSNRIVGISSSLFTELTSFHEESVLSSIQMEKIKQKVDFFFKVAYFWKQTRETVHYTRIYRFDKKKKVRP